MAYQETTTTGYGTRLGNSFKGIVSGLVMIVLGTCLLWWNEGRAVKQSDANEGALEQTTEVADISTVNPEYNGKMIHASGEAKTEEVLSDGLFGISENAFRITRDVEYYQWVERTSEKTEEKLGGSQTTTTTYYYEKDWTNSPVQSDKFKEAGHNNFVLARIESANLIAENATFGAYQLPQNFISSIGPREDYSVTLSKEKMDEFEEAVEKCMKQQGVQTANVATAVADTTVADSTTNTADSTAIATTTEAKSGYDYVTVDGNVVYLGQNPSNPNVGDVRITFSIVRQPQTVTVWADVKGNTFAIHTDKNGKTVGGLSNGVSTLQESFQQEEDTNSAMLWIFRVIGILLVFFGFKGVFGFLVTLLKVVPFLANIANVGVNLVCGLLAGIWSLVIIAIAWIFYRPILAIILLVCGAALAFFLIKRSNEKKAASNTNENVEAANK